MEQEPWTINLTWISHNNSSINNDTSFNDTCCAEDSQMDPVNLTPSIFPFNLTISLISSFKFAIACSSLFMNYLLLSGLAPVSTSVLKAKRFIQNASIANMLLAVILACNATLLWAEDSRGEAKTSPPICYLGIYNICISICLYVQAICALGLAADRVFATVRPLRYGTTGYGSTFRAAIVFLPWILAVFLWSVFMFITWTDLPVEDIPGSPMFCVHLFIAYDNAERSKTLGGFLFTANVLSFLVYISVFGAMKFRDRKIQNMTTSAARTNRSFALTFLLTNVTTLTLYLPAPMFASIAMGESYTPESWEILNGLILLYMGKTVLDPLILITRIRSIRENLPIVKKSASKSRERALKVPTVSG